MKKFLGILIALISTASVATAAKNTSDFEGRFLLIDQSSSLQYYMEIGSLNVQIRSNLENVICKGKAQEVYNTYGIGIESTLNCYVEGKFKGTTLLKVVVRKDEINLFRTGRLATSSVDLRFDNGSTFSLFMDIKKLGK